MAISGRSQQPLISQQVQSNHGTHRQLSDVELGEWRTIANRITSGNVPPENRDKLISLLEAFVQENSNDPARMADVKVSQVVATISASLQVFKQKSENFDTEFAPSSRSSTMNLVDMGRTYCFIDRGKIPKEARPVPIEVTTVVHAQTKQTISERQVGRRIKMKRNAADILHDSATSHKRKSIDIIRPEQLSYDDLDNTPTGQTGDSD
jgi:hypothetical protein